MVALKTYERSKFKEFDHTLPARRPIIQKKKGSTK